MEYSIALILSKRMLNHFFELFFDYPRKKKRKEKKRKKTIALKKNKGKQIVGFILLLINNYNRSNFEYLEPFS